MNTEKERLMNQTYQQFLSTGFGLNSADTLDDIADDKLMGFGTTVDEKVFNLTDLKRLLASQQEQSAGLDLRWEVSPLSHYTSADENTAFFADDLFVNVTINGETIKMYLRFSVVLTYVNGQWKVIHWHGSKPENVQSEEDTFGIETWKQKAEALEKLVAERTADLVGKNRELEIEASLERVRAVAMSMRKPDDLLSVAKSLFAELKSLGFHETRNALINTFNDEESFFLDYDYSDFLGGHITIIPYNTHPLIEKHLNQIRKATDAFAETIVTQQELESWVEGRRANGEPEDPQLQNISALYYYFYSTGPAAIGLSTYSALSNEKRELLKRFRNVFELAYQRYTDIQKAEAQAREALIQLALERVRARTMAMHKSEELKEVIQVVYVQLVQLNIQVEHAGFIVDYKEQDDMHIWLADQHAVPSQITIPYFDSPHWNSFRDAKEKGLDFFTNQLSFDQKNTFYKALFTLFSVPEEAKDYYFNCPGLAISTVLLDNVGLYIENFSGLAYNDEENATLMRFGKVFQQTYTRFLDLQKAEAQTREAQIETALERIRARTMAMQHSNELAEASFLLDSQVRALGIKTWGCAFNIYGDNESTEWFSSETGTMPTYKTPRENLFLRYYHIGHSGKTMHVETYAGEACVAHYNYLCTVPVMGEGLKKIKEGGGSFPVQQTDHVVYFKYGYLLFITLEPEPEAYDIFIRFAKIFEQTYTRFLDLQKAEAQAEIARLNLIQIQQEKQRAEDALTELQVTQKQLIQSEKMASLGELTAGIAHEIQNPLNFVNNFSEVSKELLEEMGEAIDKGDAEEAKEIMNDVIQNLKK